MGTDVDELTNELRTELLESPGHARLLLRYRIQHAWDASSVAQLLEMIDELYSSGHLSVGQYEDLRAEVAAWSPARLDEPTDEYPALVTADVEDPTEELDDVYGDTANLPILPDIAPPAPDTASTDDDKSAQTVLPDTTEAVLPPVLEPGATLADRYILERLIGDGGYSLVFLARDRHRDALHGAAAEVAIKALRPHWNQNSQAIARLKQEFAVVAQLTHPGIVRMYDIDCDRGQWYLVMEYLEGESLDRRLGDRERPAPSRTEALELIDRCAEAIDFAHAHRVVHGDLKPGNVFVTSTGEVRLLDWSTGIRSGESPATGTGRTATPAYASPQVLDGALPGRSDDIFSLAVIAYELLGQRHPFDRGAARVWRNAGRRPDPLATLPAAAAAALDRTLAWESTDRPETAKELARSLAVADPPLEAAPAPAPVPATAIVASTAPASQIALSVPDGVSGRDPYWPELRRWLAAHRRWSAVLIVAAILLAAWLAIRWVQRPSTPRPVDAETSDVATNARSDLPAADRLPEHAVAPVAVPDNQPTEGIEPPAAAAVNTPVVEPAVALASTTEETLPAPARPAPLTRVSFGTQNAVTSEAAVAAVLLVERRDNLNGRARVTWRATSATAMEGEDFGPVASGVAEFADGQSLRAIYINLIQNVAAEGEEFFLVELSSTQPNLRIGTAAQATVTIRDDD